MLRVLVPVLAVFITTSSVAQQQPPMSQDDMISIIQTLEGQRNQAQTNHAMAEARAAALTKENAKLKAELEQLKKPPEGSK